MTMLRWLAGSNPLAVHNEQEALRLPVPLNRCHVATHHTARPSPRPCAQAPAVLAATCTQAWATAPPTALTAQRGAQWQAAAAAPTGASGQHHQPPRKLCWAAKQASLQPAPADQPHQAAVLVLRVGLLLQQTWSGPGSRRRRRQALAGGRLVGVAAGLALPHHQGLMARSSSGRPGGQGGLAQIMQSWFVKEPLLCCLLICACGEMVLQAVDGPKSMLWTGQTSMLSRCVVGVKPAGLGGR